MRENDDDSEETSGDNQSKSYWRRNLRGGTEERLKRRQCRLRSSMTMAEISLKKPSASASLKSEIYLSGYEKLMLSAIQWHLCLSCVIYQ